MCDRLQHRNQVGLRANADLESGLAASDKVAIDPNRTEPADKAGAVQRWISRKRHRKRPRSVRAAHRFVGSPGMICRSGSGPTEI